MKNKMIKGLVFIMLFAAAATLSISAENFKGFVICIDPGHQKDGVTNSTQEPIGPGANEKKPCVSSGTRGKIAGSEANVVLDIGLRLNDILTSQGITVLMTRKTSDVDICNSERAAIANKAKADLAVRLHLDAGNQHDSSMLCPAKIEGWTDDIYEPSKKAAEIVQNAFSKYSGIPSAKNAIVERKDLSGFNYSDVPVILAEMIHMQNENDDKLVATPEFRQKMAEGLALGIIEYLKTLPPKK